MDEQLDTALIAARAAARYIGVLVPAPHNILQERLTFAGGLGSVFEIQPKATT